MLDWQARRRNGTGSKDEVLIDNYLDVLAKNEQDTVVGYWNKWLEWFGKGLCVNLVELAIENPDNDTIENLINHIPGTP